MPSWKIHSKWGTKLLGFSEREIDYLIDSTHVENHDAGCWDEKVLERQLSYVAQKYGQKGQSYYILHCILDRAEQRLLSILSEEAIKHLQ